MDNLTLLTEEETISHKKLKIFQKVGLQAEITDFAVATGGLKRENIKHQKLISQYGRYWIIPEKVNFDETAKVVDTYGFQNYAPVFSKNVSIRLVASYKSIEELKQYKLQEREDGILEIEYGFYPQTIAPRILKKEIQKDYEKNLLEKTNNVYTIDSRKLNEFKPFNAITLEEYKKDNYYFVRVPVNSSYNIPVKFTNQLEYSNGDYIWIMVDPIKWLVDEESHKIVTKNLLLSGIQLRNTKAYNGNFKTTHMQKYINEFLLSEIFQKHLTEEENPKVRTR